MSKFACLAYEIRVVFSAFGTLYYALFYIHDKYKQRQSKHTHALRMHHVLIVNCTIQIGTCIHKRNLKGSQCKCFVLLLYRSCRGFCYSKQQTHTHTKSDRKRECVCAAHTVATYSTRICIIHSLNGIDLFYIANNLCGILCHHVRCVCVCDTCASHISHFPLTIVRNARFTPDPLLATPVGFGSC